MKKIENQTLTGERALFNSKNVHVDSCVFLDGESPLKESRNLEITNSIFKWKYPLWYCDNVKVSNTTLLDTARSGIWYTNNIEISNTIIQAPKTFRRASGVMLTKVAIPNAQETFWNCNNIRLTDVSANGDYFALNSSDLVISKLNLTGNYAFDGAKNVEVRNSKLISKDAFWNCENVTVYDSVIIGEYIVRAK